MVLLENSASVSQTRGSELSFKTFSLQQPERFLPPLKFALLCAVHFSSSTKRRAWGCRYFHSNIKAFTMTGNIRKPNLAVGAGAPSLSPSLCASLFISVFFYPSGKSGHTFSKSCTTIYRNHYLSFGFLKDQFHQRRRASLLLRTCFLL